MKSVPRTVDLPQAARNAALGNPEVMRSVLVELIEAIEEDLRDHSAAINVNATEGDEIPRRVWMGM